MSAKRQHTGLSSVACDATEALRTITLDDDDEIERASSVGFYFTFANGAAGTTIITVTVYKSANKGTRWCQVPAWTYAGSGKYTGEDYTQEITVTAAGDFMVDVDMRNANAVKMVFATDTADAADAMTVDVCSDYNRN